jgi:hypothetical protein
LDERYQDLVEVPLVSEGWRKSRGGWVGEFGPLHTQSSLWREKTLGAHYSSNERASTRLKQEKYLVESKDDVSESIDDFSTLDINKEVFLGSNISKYTGDSGQLHSSDDGEEASGMSAGRHFEDDPDL